MPYSYKHRYLHVYSVINVYKYLHILYITSNLMHINITLKHLYLIYIVSYIPNLLISLERDLQVVCETGGHSVLLTFPKTSEPHLSHHIHTTLLGDTKQALKQDKKFYSVLGIKHWLSGFGGDERGTQNGFYITHLCFMKPEQKPECLVKSDNIIPNDSFHAPSRDPYLPPEYLLSSLVPIFPISPCASSEVMMVVKS